MTRTTRDITFMKMHGLGNDFVVFDSRLHPVDVTPHLARALGDRHRGVGFDQLADIRPGSDGADAHLVFYNSDGSTSAACGNATRCIARHLMTESGASELVLTTDRGRLLPGLRADVVVMERDSRRIVPSFCGGTVAYMSGDVAGRFMA